MPGEIKVSVRNELNKVIEDLERIRNKSTEVQEALKGAGRDTGDLLNDQVKKTEGFFAQLQSLGGRVADQLRGDFKSLLSINALQGALSISNQFKNSLGETVSLSDQIRKLGASFGIATKDFVSFQERITKGMGDIGLSSEDAATALKGLSGTGVRGEGNLIEYSKTSAQLGSLGGEKGQGGAIAGLLANIVRERGGNVQDPRQMQEVARAVAKAMESTGKGASEILQTMRETFAAMPKELRKSMSPEAMAQISVAGTVAGPSAMKPLQKFLSMSKEERAGMEAQGFGKIFGPGGQLNLKGLQDIAKELKSRGTSSRMAAQTLGFQGEEAEGLVRLIDSADSLAEALERTSKASDDYATKARNNMSLTEAFSANINKVKGIFAGPLSQASQGLSNVLSGASKSTVGSLGVVAGGGTLAALLAGGALKGIGKGMGIGGLAKGAAIEAATGRQVTPVYVVNASEIRESGGGIGEKAGMVGSMLGKGAGLLKGAGIALGTYEIANAIGKEIEPSVTGGLNKYTSGTTSEGFQGNIVEQLFFKLDRLLGGSTSGSFAKQQKVLVELNKRDLKESKQPTRGASN